MTVKKFLEEYPDCKNHNTCVWYTEVLKPEVYSLTVDELVGGNNLDVVGRDDRFVYVVYRDF